MTETKEAVSTPGAGAQPAAPAPAASELDPRRWLALASVMTALFMVLLDVSIVNVAIPAIRSNLSANNADIQFVIAGYGLAYAVLLITGGRLGDIFGRKRMFIIGMSGFVIASALCGLAQSAIMLDLSRVLQGGMAAMMYPQVLSVIQVTFPPQERAKVFGFVGAVIGIATITGPLAGGLIIRNDITGGSWRWIFLVNLPIGIGALIAATRLITESRAPNATRLDFGGVILSTAGIPAFFFTFSLMVQVGLGFSALNAGLTTIPWSLASAVASFMSTRVAPRLGKYTIAIGSALLVIGILGVIGTLHLQGTKVTGWDLIPSFIVSGLGLGTVIAPLLNIILAGVPGRDAGSASGVLTTFQQLGGAIGVAVVGVVFFGLLSSRAPSSLATVTPQLQSQLAAANVPAPAIQSAIATFTTCFEEQASSSDPSAPIPGCSTNGTGPVAAAFAGAAQVALGRVFVTSVERILFFNVGFWFLTGLLSMLLPRAKPRPAPGAVHAA